jgi:hypothetical protein
LQVSALLIGWNCSGLAEQWKLPLDRCGRAALYNFHYIGIPDEWNKWMELAENYGATRRDRTGDLLITNQPLYQLS